MSKRAALLIGVSEYGDGFEPLPGSRLDVEEMARVLQDPDCGMYELTAFQNLSNDIVSTKIETFFRGRDKDDLLLFYFSGHGDLGAGGFSNQQLHLCTNNSTKDNGTLIESTAFPASFLKRQMDNCRAKNIIVILDCCYSGAIADLLKKGEEEIDFQELQAEGRVILASSSSSKVALQEPDGLSLYTKFLIEGMRGAAPFEHKWIKARQLHEYADRRFEVERRGGYRPKIIADDTGYNLPIVKAPKPDPKLEYRQEVDRIFQELDHDLHLDFNGEIDDPLDRGSLETCRERWKLTSEEALAIEKQVQEPYLIRAQKRKKYAEFVEYALEAPSKRAVRRLDEICNNLGLGKEDVYRIEEAKGFDRQSVQQTQVISSEKQTKQADQDNKQISVDTLDERYADLDRLLKAQEWKKADKETYRLMITKVGRREGDYFRTSDLENYPCKDLRVIDQLWVQHSKGLFGFSVQKKIWEECGSPKEYNKAWENFGDRVGWRAENNWLSYDSLNPSLSSPKGNFPWGVWWVEGVGGWVSLEEGRSLSREPVSSLASRLVDCKL